ncbi:MAG TPA: class I SAM-dependent methyltransferase [Fontimonas sp.]
MNWSHGYNVSSGYTYGFYRELAPDWINYGALLHGHRVPDASGAFRYLELGCGQGFGLCLLAASYPQAEFIGVDFNPEHVAHARDLAAAAQLHNVRFEEADFSVLAQQWPEDFGRFEYVVLHGIYSWVPVPLRQALVRSLDHAGKPGGLVYVSYNTLPGWTSAIPLQHLLRRLQMQSTRSGPQVIQHGGELMNRLVAANAGVAAAYPYLKARLETLETQNPSYLVQEYLHENWHPLWFSQVAEELAGAKLSYVGSATLPENYLPALLSPQLAEIVRSGEGQTMQQELIDLAINQSFRRDLYCRGPRALHNSMARLSAFTLHAQRRPEVSDTLTIQTTAGTLSIQRVIVEAIFDALAEAPMTIGELARLEVFTGKAPQEPIQVATLLLSAGHVSLSGAQRAGTAIRAFNRTVAGRVAAEFLPYPCLATPLSPTGVAVGDVDMLLYLLVSDEAQAGAMIGDPYRLATCLIDALQASGRALLRGGRPIEIPEERFDHAAQIAKDFIDRVLPSWRRLGVL